MSKAHGGTGHRQGSLNRGTALKPSLTHGGTNLAKGQVRSPRPQVFGPHGGTNLPRVLKRK
jgi:hypothetical protein